MHPEPLRGIKEDRGVEEAEDIECSEVHQSGGT